ncbi:hypothetical protein [Kitasatospora griseola]|uniref:hypothetical protein n=1 Tax=Kitasatospora griseola TaxID=2064 RepID=UPI003667C3DF
MTDLTTAATCLNEDLAELFENWEIPRGASLRDYPYATEKLIEILNDHAERIAPHRYVEGDRYPVVITTTQRYIVWVEAENARDAVESTNDNSEWYELIDGQTAVDGGYDVAAPDRWENHLIHEHRLGPNRGCSTCNSPQPWDHILPIVQHTETCPIGLAQRAEREARWERDRQERLAARNAQQPAAY